MLSLTLSLTSVFAVLAFATACQKEADGPLEIHDIQPRSGVLQGRETVKIASKNLRRDIGYTVYFGAEEALQTSVADSNTLLAVTPKQERVGTYDVYILADDGAAFRIKESFEYVANAPSTIPAASDEH